MTMHAIVERDDTLVWDVVERPDPGPGEVRIRVEATAVNRADLVQRSGSYPPPPGASPILGLECTGVIDAVGEGVSDRAVGDAVVALLAGGGYAEYVVCPAVHTLPRPEGFDVVQSAAVMEVFATAWLNLREEAGLVDGERVLVHAGASGVGTAALQLLQAWGCPTFATVGSEAKVERCARYGAEATIRHGGWVEAVRAWGPVDVVLCPVGASYLADNLSVLRTRGRLVLIGLMGGREATLPMGRLLVKRLTVKGSVLRARAVDEKARIVAGVGREVWPLLASGTVRPVVDTVLPITEAAQAHELIAGNGTIGKVVLTVPG
jgi:putative PIG3 family NAD(P)H quinone oxidoreductase